MRHTSGSSLVALLLAPLAAAAAPAQPLSGTIRVDGSSTVYPITAAAAEMFSGQQPDVEVTVGISGTGGGFKKFLEDKPELRTDIQDASRPITAAELEKAGKLGVQFIELPVAYDGIAVVVNPKNTFCNHLTVAELKKIWEPDSKINNWKDVRPGFPDVPLKLYGPGTDSGTFDYFTEAIIGKSKSCRADFMPSEDDNVLVKGVEGDAGALGYFGLAYFEANQARLKLLGVDNGNGQPVRPDSESVRKLIYTPLARPLFLYVNVQSLQRPEVRGFLDFYLANAKKIAEHPRVGYIALSDKLYHVVRERLAQGVTGTIYTSPDAQSRSLYELYRLE